MSLHLKTYEGASALIYEPVTHTRILLTEQLTKLRVRPITYAYNHNDLYMLARQQGQDLVIINWSEYPSDRIFITQLMLMMGQMGELGARFMLVTRDPRQSVLREAMTLGFCMILIKPFTIKSLNERIRWVLDRGRPAETASMALSMPPPAPVAAPVDMLTV